MFKKLKSKYYKNVRLGIYQVFVKHFKLRVLRVKPCTSITTISLPTYIPHICHYYSKFVEDTTYLKSKPIILLDLKNKEIVTHFILTDGFNFYDCSLNENELNTLRYFEFPEDIEKEIMKHNHPDKRLFTAKSILASAITIKSKSVSRLFLWRLLELNKKINYL